MLGDVSFRVRFGAPQVRSLRTLRFTSIVERLHREISDLNLNLINCIVITVQTGQALDCLGPKFAQAAPAEKNNQSRTRS